MNTKGKLLACGAAALLTSGCTYSEMQSFAIGATAALVVASVATENSGGHDGGYDGDDFSNAYGPTSCGPDETLELGYDENDNPARFCAPAGPFITQGELRALAAQAQ